MTYCFYHESALTGCKRMNVLYGNPSCNRYQSAPEVRSPGNRKPIPKKQAPWRGALLDLTWKTAGKPGNIKPTYRPTPNYQYRKPNAQPISKRTGGKRSWTYLILKLARKKCIYLQISPHVLPAVLCILRRKISSGDAPFDCGYTLVAWAIPFWCS